MRSPNDLVRLCVLETLWRAHSHFSGTLERAGHQPEPGSKQREHHYEDEQSRVLKVDLKICENAYKDDYRAAAGQDPAGDRAAVEEQKSQANN